MKSRELNMAITTIQKSNLPHLIHPSKRGMEVMLAGLLQLSNGSKISLL